MHIYVFIYMYIMGLGCVIYVPSEGGDVMKVRGNGQRREDKDTWEFRKW